MAITVTFNMSDDKDREDVARMIAAYETSDGESCCAAHTPKVVIVPGIDPNTTITPGSIKQAFAATLPDEDGAEPLPPLGTFGTTPVPAAAIDAGDDVGKTGAVATVSTVPAPTATAPAVDSAGIPWDARIHSSSKTTVADGTWRAKKGLNPVVKQQVEAELRGVPVVPTVPVAAGSISAPVAPAIPTPPVPPAPAAASESEMTFAQFLTRVTQSKIDMATINKLCAECVPPVAFATLSANPGSWSQIIARLPQ